MKQLPANFQGLIYFQNPEIDMVKRIDFDDLFDRVSGNKEFAQRMIVNFFSTWMVRTNKMEADLNEEKYDDLADGAHQLKGILGNLSIQKGFHLLKTIHEEAKLKNPKKLVKLLSQLKKEITAAEKDYNDNLSLFQ